MSMTSPVLSADRLARLHDILARHVDRGTPPGLVAVLSRGGDQHVEAIGRASVDGPPVQRDTIFRISSMTKPITAVATLILLEECVLRLDEPVDRFLPELADRRVVRRIDRPARDTPPPERSITPGGLLSFRMGVGGLFWPGPPHQLAPQLPLPTG